MLHKTNALRFSEFKPFIEWWIYRGESEHAWRVPLSEVLEYDNDGSLVAANLDVKNPNAPGAERLPSPSELLNRIAATEQQVFDLMSELEAVLEEL